MACPMSDQSPDIDIAIRSVGQYTRCYRKYYIYSIYPEVGGQVSPRAAGLRQSHDVPGQPAPGHAH